jgi:hypothetical protein
MAELADALDLGSSGQPWGFESPFSHHGHGRKNLNDRRRSFFPEAHIHDRHHGRINYTPVAHLWWQALDRVIGNVLISITHREVEDRR